MNFISALFARKKDVRPQEEPPTSGPSSRRTQRDENRNEEVHTCCSSETQPRTSRHTEFLGEGEAKKDGAAEGKTQDKDVCQPQGKSRAKRKLPPWPWAFMEGRPREFVSFHYRSQQVYRSLLRREFDYNRKYQEQIGRGRPGTSWRLCSDPGCGRRRCLYTDPIFLPIAYVTYGRNNRPVARRRRLFIDTMVKHLFGDLRPRAKMIKVRAMESFLWSPPLRGACGQFEVLCNQRGWKPAEKALARVLTEIRNGVLYLASTTRLGEPVQNGHALFGGEKEKYPEDWRLKQLAMQFCAVAEAWRRYGLSRGADWDFGSDEAVADFLCAVLQDFLGLRTREAIETKRHDILQLNEAWELWLDVHYWPTKGGEETSTGCSGREEQGTQGGERTRCFEGFGQASTPWMSKRMKQTCDDHQAATHLDASE